MLIVRYCDKEGRIIDKIVADYEAYYVFKSIKSQFGQADLILTTQNSELCIF